MGNLFAYLMSKPAQIYLLGFSRRSKRFDTLTYIEALTSFGMHRRTIRV